MKRLSFLIPFLFLAVLVNAQAGKVTQASNYIRPEYNQFEKAKTLIDEAIEHEKTIGVSKTWKVRGDVYLAIATSEDANVNSLSDNPLQISFESYKKALELDDKGKMKKYIDPKLATLKIAFFNKGGEYYNESEYAKSFKCFESVVLAGELLADGTVDTVAMNNAALTATNAEMFPEAVKYYEKVIGYKYGGVAPYVSLARVQKTAGDTLAFAKTLEDGIVAYPAESYQIVLELINHYLQNNESEKAMAYVDKGLEAKPDNETLYFAKGTLLDKLKDFDGAKAAYEKSFELKPDFFKPYYNLGAMYFNKGREMLIAANDIPANKPKEYDAAVQESFLVLEKALPHLEKAWELNSSEETIALTMKEIYFKLRTKKPEYQTRYDELNEMLKK